MSADLLRVESQNGVQVLELSLPDQVDASLFDALNDSVANSLPIAEGQVWVVDLSGVNYVGSAVLGLLVNFRQRVKAAGARLVLCSLSPRLTEIFHTSSLQRLFTISRTREDAFEWASM